MTGLTQQQLRTLAVHPVADLFPMLPDDELKELADDISERGLLQPIVLDQDGRILDGRNRHAACQIAGIEPTFETYDGPDADGYALTVNIARRHLSAGARAIIAAQAARLQRVAGKEQAAIANLQLARLAEANQVLDWAPDLVPNVVAGVHPLYKAVETAPAGMTGSQVVTGNRQLAARALDMARREPGRRAAWLCVSVACGEFRTVAAARTALGDVHLPAVRGQALQLLDQLAAGETI